MQRDEAKKGKESGIEIKAIFLSGLIIDPVRHWAYSKSPDK